MTRSSAARAALCGVVVAALPVALGLTAADAAPRAVPAASWLENTATVSPGNGSFGSLITLSPTVNCPAGTTGWNGFLSVDSDVDPATGTGYAPLFRANDADSFGSTTGPLPTISDFTLSDTAAGDLPKDIGAAGTYRVGYSCENLQTGAILALVYGRIALAGDIDDSPSWTAIAPAAGPTTAPPGGAGTTSTPTGSPPPTAAPPSPSAGVGSPAADASRSTSGIPSPTRSEVAVGSSEGSSSVLAWSLGGVGLVAAVGAAATYAVRRRRPRGEA